MSDNPDYEAITPLLEVVDLFGTATPTREMTELNEDLFEAIDRSQGMYIVALPGREAIEDLLRRQFVRLSRTAAALDSVVDWRSASTTVHVTWATPEGRLPFCRGAP